MKKIGIYISAFDPVHNGHIKFAEDAVEKYGLDRLYFLVEPRPRYAQGVKALEHRVNMAILAVSKNPKLGTIVTKSKTSVDEYIKLLQTRFRGHKLTLIVPDFALKRFFRLPNLLNYNFANTEILVGLINQSAEEVSLRLRLLSETSGLQFTYSWFKAKASNINGSEVKRKLKQGVIPDEMPKAVYEYIVNKRLYSAAPSS